MYLDKKKPQSSVCGFGRGGALFFYTQKFIKNDEEKNL